MLHTLTIKLDYKKTEMFGKLGTSGGKAQNSPLWDCVTILCFKCSPIQAAVNTP